MTDPKLKANCHFKKSARFKDYLNLYEIVQKRSIHKNRVQTRYKLFNFE